MTIGNFLLLYKNISFQFWELATPEGTEWPQVMGKRGSPWVVPGAGQGSQAAVKSPDLASTSSPAKRKGSSLKQELCVSPGPAVTMEQAPPFCSGRDFIWDPLFVRRGRDHLPHPSCWARGAPRGQLMAPSGQLQALVPMGMGPVLCMPVCGVGVRGGGAGRWGATLGLNNFPQDRKRKCSCSPAAGSGPGCRQREAGEPPRPPSALPHIPSAVPDFLVVLGDGHVSQLLHDGWPA